MKKKVLSVILAVVMLFTITSIAFAGSQSGFGEYNHVFIIGVDGAGGAFENCDTPNFDRIFAGNTYTCKGLGEDITVSAQNWGAILTGVAYDVHGFDNDSIEEFERNSTSPNGTVFRYIKQAMPQAKLASFVHWEPINHGIIENDIGVKKVNFLSDYLVTNAFVRYFRQGNQATLTFVQLDDVDGAAHSYGGYTSQYFTAVEKADKYIGKMYDAVCDAGLMNDGLFIVVTDHGEAINGNHGGKTPEEYTVTVAVAGHNVAENADISSVRNRDVAAITLYALGIDIPAQMTAKVPENLFGDEKEDYYPNTNIGLFTRLFEKMCNLMVAVIKSFFDGIC